MATLLTLLETPFGAESCVFSVSGARGEVFSRELLADGESGVSEAAMKGRWKEAIGSGEGGQEAAWSGLSGADFQAWRGNGGRCRIWTYDFHRV